MPAASEPLRFLFSGRSISKPLRAQYRNLKLSSSPSFPTCLLPLPPHIYPVIKFYEIDRLATDSEHVAPCSSPHHHSEDHHLLSELQSQPHFLLISLLTAQSATFLKTNPMESFLCTWTFRDSKLIRHILPHEEPSGLIFPSFSIMLYSFSQAELIAIWDHIVFPLAGT